MKYIQDIRIIDAIDLSPNLSIKDLEFPYLNNLILHPNVYNIILLYPYICNSKQLLHPIINALNEIRPSFTKTDGELKPSIENIINHQPSLNTKDLKPDIIDRKSEYKSTIVVIYDMKPSIIK